MILLTDIIIIFGLSIAVLFVCYRLHVPTIVGFLLTGVLAGPYGLGLIRAIHEVEILAEVGVVLLLFAIGLEFSLKEFLRIRRLILIGGLLQVLLTLCAASVIASHLGRGLGESVFIGFLISLSSTAIVLKILQDRAEIESPHGRTTVGILIFQDIVIVPMILFTPLLAGSSDSFGQSPLILVAKGIGIILLVILSAGWIVPNILYQVARTRSRELFLLTVVAICLGIAWLTHSMGLSLALGAFLAGLIISESEYSHHALGSILPFRDVFTSFFFVSIGMLLDVGYLAQGPVLIVLTTLSIIVLKAIIAILATVLLGLPFRIAILVGLALSQVGEFSFVLSKSGTEYDLLSGDLYQLFLSVSVLTMAVTPFLIVLASHLADLVSRMPLPKRLKSGLYPVPGLSDAAKETKPRDHLIIVGFGLNGRNVARTAKLAGIPYLVIEMNTETVRHEKAKGEPIYYGDASQEAVLEHANIKYARVLVVVISDPAAARRITAMARSLNPKVHVISRTRFLQEMEPLYKLGANEVIPEEFETSVEIFARVLVRYLIPRNEIERFIAEVRADGYEMYRSTSLAVEQTSFCDLESYIPDLEVNTFRVPEEADIVGKTLSEIGLRKEYGATLLAIRRDQELLSNPGGDTRILTNDILVILAPPTKLAGIMHMFGVARAIDG